MYKRKIKVATKYVDVMAVITYRTVGPDGANGGTFHLVCSI